jgi:hypothetical protein
VEAEVVRARRRTLEPVCPDQMCAVRAVRRGRPARPGRPGPFYVAQVLEGAEQDGFADSVEELADDVVDQPVGFQKSECTSDLP